MRRMAEINRDNLVICCTDGPHLPTVPPVAHRVRPTHGTPHRGRRSWGTAHPPAIEAGKFDLLAKRFLEILSLTECETLSHRAKCVRLKLGGRISATVAHDTFLALSALSFTRACAPP